MCVHSQLVKMEIIAVVVIVCRRNKDTMSTFQVVGLGPSGADPERVV